MGSNCPCLTPEAVVAEIEQLGVKLAEVKASTATGRIIGQTQHAVNLAPVGDAVWRSCAF